MHAMILVDIPALKVIIIVMMKTTIVDVNGMEETVVVIVITIMITVMNVSALTLIIKSQGRKKIFSS